MSHIIYFWSTFLILVFVMLYLDRKYSLLRDTSTAVPKPYSFSRVQLAWWTIIILSSLIGIVLYTWNLPTFNNSTLIILGITTSTAAVARITDASDKADKNLTNLIQNNTGQNFFLDILSDKNGVSLTRFQTVVFNITFGFWFIHEILSKLILPGSSMSELIPVIETNNLILLGISSATYAGFKTTENK